MEEGGEGESTRFLQPSIILARPKSFILKLVGVTAIFSVVVSSLWSESYTVNAKIMLRQQSQSIPTPLALDFLYAGA